MEIPKDWYSHFNLLIFEEIDSTNDEAKRIAQSCVEGDFVIWSKTQSKGKGRNGKKWISNEGNLFLSILLRPNFDIKLASHLSFIMAICVGEVIAKYTKKKKLVKYKWPNDVLIEDKKIAGILIETKVKPNSTELDYLVAGVGINLKSFPSNSSFPATSLYKHYAEEILLENVINDLMKNYLAYLKIWNDKGFSEIRKLWLNNAYGLGEVITCETSASRISGIFQNINQDGAIEVILANGEQTIITSGEVFFEKAKQPFNTK